MSDAKQQIFLDELTRLLMRASTGRLDVRAPVRGDETGPLADAANHALGSFRGLVLEVRSGTEQLIQSIGRAREGNDGLGELVEVARAHLATAVTASQEMASSAQRSQASAEQCRDVAARSLEMVREARGDAKQATAELGRMRSSMNETGKRIKRLAESCQEVGDATRLIDDVADQTGVLAVNAAIQASIAGAGDEFAVVVEEIRRLSEHARAATREIESLVRAIQSDAAEAMKAAERATAELVASGEASDRGDLSLQKAERVAQSLSSAVEGLSGSVSRQGQRAGVIAGEVAGAERGVADLKGGSLAVGVAMEQAAELARALHRAEEPFHVTEEAAPPDRSAGRPAGAAHGNQTTTGGTIVLKPAQLKGVGALQSP